MIQLTPQMRLCVASASLRLGKQVAELRERYDFVRWVTSGA
jgi:hypothetical protein